jgi:archaemetzincin
MKKLLWIIPIVIVCAVAYYLLTYRNKEPVQVVDSSPHYTTIFLQPLDNFTQQEAMQLQEVLEQRFRKIFNEGFEFEFLPNKKLSVDLMNDSKSRYRADKIINSLKKEASNHRIIIGLTHKDVSVPYKGKPDWGVLGLSIHGTYACVVSDFRLKNKKRDYWKVVTHEFTHTACNYSHCPNDDPTCIMKDAKGKANFANKVTFCKTCREKINI